MAVTEEFVALEDTPEPDLILMPFAAAAPRRALVEWLLRRGRRDFQPAHVRLQKLDDALVRLAQQNPLRARIFQLHLLAGMPVSTIALELGLTEDHVEMAYQRARAAIEAELNKIA
ncbi:MAG: ECF-type sigma factor [Bryobacteraceae bacterium]|nr:ECF-type sigma factor [Bryobacteraceae bacterium]